MPEKESRWRRLQAIKIKRRDLSRRAKRAEGATVRHAHKFIIGRWDNIRHVRQHILGWMVCVAGLIIVVGVQMVWFQRSYMATAPISGGAYAEAVTGPVQTLNPLYATTNAEQAVSKLLFSSLYGYDTTGHLRGDIATSMTLDPNGKIYTVTLRPGAKWHDGTDVTAADVAFTVGLMKNPSARSTMYASWKDIEAEAIDAQTIKFTLPAVYAAFPQALTFSILPEHVLKKVDSHILRESSFSTNPVGSGPFQVRLVQVINEGNGRKIVNMGANEKYYRGAPRVDRFQLHVYGTMDEIASALRTGEVSAASDVSAAVGRNMKTNDRYDVISKPVNNGVYAIINTTRPLVKDVQVRRALQLATNSDAIRHNVFSSPPALDLPFVPGQLNGDDIPKRPVANAEAAAKLLDAAGWKVGDDGIRAKDGQQLKLSVVTRKNSNYEEVIETLAGQWRKVGMAVEARVVDPTAAGQNFTQLVLQPRDYDVLVDELVIGADPDVFAYWHSRGILNFSNYSNATSDDALVSARSRVEPDIRNVKYKAFAKQWLDDVPAIGLYQSSMIYVQSKQNRSFEPGEVIVSPADHYANVQYWTAEMGNVYKTP